MYSNCKTWGNETSLFYWSLSALGKSCKTPSRGKYCMCSLSLRPLEGLLSIFQFLDVMITLSCLKAGEICLVQDSHITDLDTPKV